MLEVHAETHVEYIFMLGIRVLSSNTVILKSFQSETLLTWVKFLRPPKYNNDSKCNFGKKSWSYPGPY
jgi:hypothetical protein